MGLKPLDRRDPTPGIDVKEINVPGAGSFVIWDTAGQTEFHITHAMFLGASRGIIGLVYDCSDSEADQREKVSTCSDCC